MLLRPLFRKPGIMLPFFVSTLFMFEQDILAQDAPFVAEFDSEEKEVPNAPEDSAAGEGESGAVSSGANAAPETSDTSGEKSVSSPSAKTIAEENKSDEKNKPAEAERTGPEDTLSAATARDEENKPDEAEGTGPEDAHPAATSKDEKVDLGTVTVVGTNEVQDLKESGFPVTVIDPAKFAGRAMSVSDLLARVPGVRISRSGGIGSANRISIRGLEGKRVKIYIDDAPLNAPDDSFGIDDIPLHVIERIEVYKGVVPAKLGGDGLGGAVNIVTVDLPPRYADFSYEIQSHNSHKVMALAKTYFEKPGIEAGFFIQGQYADNDYSMTQKGKNSGTPANGAQTIIREHSRFRSLLLANAYHFKKNYFDDLELELVYIANDQQIQGLPWYTGTTADVPVRNVQHAKTWSNIWLAAIHAERDDFLLDKLDFSYNIVVPFLYSGLVDKSDTVYDFEGNSEPSPMGEGEIGGGPNDSKNKQFEVRQRMNLNYQLFRPFAINLNSQLQYTDHRPSDDYADEYLGWQVTPGDGKLFTSVTGLSGELKLFRDKWMTIAAFKHYYFHSRGYETVLYPSADESFLSDREEENTDSGFGWNVATRYKIVPWLLLKGSYERGQRMPTKDEVFGDGFTIKTSPLLAPEKSDNFVAGFFLDKSFGKGPRAIRVTLESDVFLMYIDDMIRLGGTLTKNYANVDKAKIKGIDGEVKLELTRYFYSYFNWTWQDVRNDSNYLPGTTQKNYLKGKAIPNMPPYFFNWGAEFTLYDIMWDWAQPCELSIFYDGNYVSEFLFEYEVSKNQKRRVDSRVLHDAGVQLSMKEKRYSLSFSVNNIADTLHQDLYNQPLAGRIFKLALRGTFH